MNNQTDLFSRLPPEVIQHIAVAACGLTPIGPPNELATLLRVCRAIHGALSAEHHPALHRRIFSVKFDSRAPTRRFVDAGQPLTARSFAIELRRRWIALKRIYDVPDMGTLLACSEENLREDMWMIYLMFIESDGRNFHQLNWARVTKYLRIVFKEQLVPSPKPGYMVESTTRALGFWMMWYLTEAYAVVDEPPPDAAQMRAMLRPWALASHKYDILCAPYTHWTFPASDEPSLSEDISFGNSQKRADLDLRNRVEVVTHMGRRIQLAPPRASQAAIMALMVRLERHGPIPNPTQPAPPIPPGQPGPAVPQGHPGLTIYPRTRYPAFFGPGSLEFDGRINRSGSAAYDVEWRRVVQCGNPFATLKFKPMPMFRPGELVGQWEGRVVFLTIDAFRDMLAEVPGAVTNGLLAQNHSSWRIWEHHLVSRRRRVPLGRELGPSTGEKLPIGDPLDAFIPKNAQLIQHGDPRDAGTRRLEVRILDQTSPLGYQSYNYITLDETTDLPPIRVPTNHVLRPSPPPIDMDESPDWEKPQPPNLGDGDYEFEEEIVDTLITGEGRSSGGPFKLQGRVRAWDGMIILLVEYYGVNAQSRGRWLYKGYVVAGGNWIGRWRETYTEQELNGYEGVFSMTKQY